MSELALLSKDDIELLIERTVTLTVAQLTLARPDDAWMDKKAAAAHLGCDISKVNRYMKKGLPYGMCGSTPRFKKVDLDKWIDSRERVQEVQGEKAKAKGQGLG